MSGRTKLGVLVSGSGSNLQALLDACARPDFPAEVAVVVSNVPTAFALERARKAGVAAVVLEHKAFGSRADFEKALVEKLVAAGVEWVCLAGFMRLLGVDFLGRFAGKVLNIHPSLLPAFPGLHAQRQALERGVKLAGCTVRTIDPPTALQVHLVHRREDLTAAAAAFVALAKELSQDELPGDEAPNL